MKGKSIPFQRYFSQKILNIRLSYSNLQNDPRKLSSHYFPYRISLPAPTSVYSRQLEVKAALLTCSSHSAKLHSFVGWSSIIPCLSSYNPIIIFMVFQIFLAILLPRSLPDVLLLKMLYPVSSRNPALLHLSQHVLLCR